MIKINTISRIATKIIESCYILLFFFTPLVFTSFNSELFEFNKMILTYILATIIVSCWFLKMIVEKRIIFKKTFWDIPIIIFFTSQFLSTIFSHDLYLSLYGYYSRFNQGLFSLIAYLILYFAFTTNIKTKSFLKLLFLVIIASSIIVAIYGIFQHFGLDFFHWVQDVKTRVFSSMGQPNWLGAYLTIILMITSGIYFSFLHGQATEENNLKFKMPLTILAILYAALLFTRSRSSFAAFHFCFGILTIYELSLHKKFKKMFIGIYLMFFLLINIFNIFPTPIEKVNGLTIPNLIQKITKTQNNNPARPAVAVAMAGEGGTESFAIRKIVWVGAWNTFINNPILGYGNETFAIAYYKYKPISQNLVSEWDFLYNKAHNEYLNYLATTGIVGFGAYVLLIISFILYFCRGDACRRPWAGARPAPTTTPINLALFLAWFSILITNFVGFSVVVTSIFFYMIPAFIVVLNQTPENEKENQQSNSATIKQYSAIFILLFTVYCLLSTVTRWWLADIHFARAERLSSQNLYAESYAEYENAVDLSPQHPTYHNEFSIFLGDMSSYIFMQKDQSLAKKIAEKAIQENDTAIEISPNNPIFYNYRALIFYNLRLEDKTYAKDAVEAITKAKLLSPNDPKITYYLAIYLLNSGENKKAMLALKQATVLKPNYVEAVVNYAKILSDAGQKAEAAKTLQNLLKYYPDNVNIVNLIKSYKE